MSSQRQFVLGLFFLSALSVLGYYTLFLADFTLFGKPAQLAAHFPEAHGLREGDKVTVSGMLIGRVSKMSYDPSAPRDQRITVVMNLNEPLELREGYTISIKEATLLGGRNIDIEPGEHDARPIQVDATRALPGKVERNPIAALEEVGLLVKENRATVMSILENFDQVVVDLRSGKGPIGRLLTDEVLAQNLSDSVQRLATTLADAQLLTADLRDGKGTLGKLFVDQSLYDSAVATAADLQALSADLRAGKGVLGSLLQDEELASELDQTVFELRGMLVDLRAGKGTLGQLLTDASIANNLREVSGQLARGEGTLGRLLSDDRIYTSFAQIGEDLRQVSAALRNGEGSLGRLIMEREIYDEALSAVRLLNRSLEDYREAAPVSTFTSVLFSAF